MDLSLRVTPPRARVFRGGRRMALPFHKGFISSRSAHTLLYTQWNKKKVPFRYGTVETIVARIRGSIL